MSLPSAVTRYLYTLDSELRKSICLSFDDTFRLTDWWGDVNLLSNAPLFAHQDVRDIVPALFGVSLEKPIRMEFVGLASDKVFHLHVFQEGSDHFVLLIPALDAEARTIELQQVANEVRLLNERQSKLLAELEKTKSDLQEKGQIADRASMVKSRFIASMSHEFRTPLTSVIGYTELLLSDADQNSDVSAHAGAIRRSAHHLLSMVDNILDQSRIEEGNVAIHIAALNVRQLTDDIAAMMAPLAAEKFLAFAAYVESDVPSKVRTDEVRLRQILVNLVGNAIKFTDHGEVKLEISWANDRLILEVTDTGPGIPKDQQKRIFEAFHRVVGRDAGKRGTGLGLNITTRLVELLNGSIELVSEPGRGSQFSVNIAAESSEHSSTAAPMALYQTKFEGGGATGQRILVAEDDPDLIELLSLFLARGGYQLILANDGQEAVEIAMATDPDLVLMDVNMPNLDGLSAVRILRSKGFDKPVLALTASLSANDRDQAFSWGCDGYLVKPVSMPELLTAVDRHLHHKA